MQMMTTARCFVALLLVNNMLAIEPSHAQARHPEWLAGERLCFAAEFLHMELGAVEFEMLPQVDTLGATLHHARAAIRSNSRFPLLQVQIGFESYFDHDFNSYFFASQELRSDGMHHRVARFDQNKKHVVIEEWRDLGRKVVDKRTFTLSATGGLRDAITTFYLLRSLPAFSSTPQSFHILNGQRPDSVLVNTVAAENNYQKAAMLQGLSQTPENKNAVQIICRLPFIGIAGLKKDIFSFFSTDGLALPLNTELQVYLGKVRLRLVERRVAP